MTDPEHPPGHEPPRGTLAIVSIYGALFVVGWLLIFFLVFVRRGT